jgi:hypothetical protein
MIKQELEVLRSEKREVTIYTSSQTFGGVVIEFCDEYLLLKESKISYDQWTHEKFDIGAKRLIFIDKIEAIEWPFRKEVST